MKVQDLLSRLNYFKYLWGELPDEVQELADNLSNNCTEEEKDNSVWLAPLYGDERMVPILNPESDHPTAIYKDGKRIEKFIRDGEIVAPFKILKDVAR